jgi:hypothetical protein
VELGGKLEGGNLRSYRFHFSMTAGPDGQCLGRLWLHVVILYENRTGFGIYRYIHTIFGGRRRRRWAPDFLFHTVCVCPLPNPTRKVIELGVLQDIWVATPCGLTEQPMSLPTSCSCENLRAISFIRDNKLSENQLFVHNIDFSSLLNLWFVLNCFLPNMSL